MRVMKRIALNFLILNLVAVAVGWLVTDRCLHFLSITVDAKAPVTIRPSTEFGTFGFEGKGLETVTAVQPTDAKEISLSFVGPRGGAKVVEVRYSEHVVLNRCWAGDAIEVDGRGIVKLDPAVAHWGVCPFFFTVVGAVEILLLILGAFVAWITREDRFSGWMDALVVAFAFAVFVCLVVPLQTYLGNSECFSFKIEELLPDLLPRMLVSGALVFSLLLLCGGFAGRFWLAMTVAVLVYEYLETGLLSIGNPPLDGDAIVYKGLVRGMWDAAVLVGLVVVFFLVRNTTASLWTSLAVLVLSLCSLVDSHKEKESLFRSDIIDHPTDNDTVVKSTVFSAKKNVMLLFLDCISTTHVQDVFAQSDELRASFDGFTFCTNNVGMYWSTRDGVPAILTGRYHDVNEKEKEFVSEIFCSNSVIRAFIGRSSAVVLAPGCVDFGLTTEVAGLVTNAVKRVEEGTDPFYRRMVDQQRWNVYEIVKFRMTPYVFKYYVYSLAVYGWGVSVLGVDESMVFPSVAEARVKEGCDLAFLSYHTLGAHPPYGVDRNGEHDPKLRIGYCSKFEKTWYSLRCVTELFRRLKERGLYDKTFIILLADHGGEPLVSDDTVRPTDAPARAFPFLMFKPIGVRGSPVESNVPTSHAKVNELLRRVAQEDVSKDEALSLLCCSNRIYRGRNGNVWSEYRFGADCFGSFTQTRLSGSKVTEPIALGREYSFGAGKEVPPIEIVSQGEEGMAFEGLRLVQPPAAWKMRVPESETDYQVVVDIWMIANALTGSEDFCVGRLKDIQSGNGVEVSVPAGPRFCRRLSVVAHSNALGEILLSFVCTGEYGLQTIKIQK